jgi:hypothetical protein
MEQIYTIPINEAFEKCADERSSCPFCEIYTNFEKNEIDLILGASMMEPDVRIKTNELGFCREHYGKMLRAGKKLPIALLLESHLDEVADKVRVNRLIPTKSAKGSATSISKMSETCYVCDRLNTNFEKVLDNAVYMWLTDADFRRKVADQKCFCLPHYAAFLKAASHGMKSHEFRNFSSSLRNIEEKYLSAVRENISFFIKKFDYRYENEPWGDAKDAVERAISALSGQNDY